MSNLPREPVAWMFWNDPDTQRHFSQLREPIGNYWTNIVPLYAAPAQPAEPPAQAATERMGTHWETCATDGGPRHYDCALRLIERQAREIVELDAANAIFKKRERESTEREFVLEQQRDALRADAERYRWLRPHFRTFSLDMGGQHRYCIDSELGRIRGPSIDAAIDAARAKVRT